jgi:hypothetical protein
MLPYSQVQPTSFVASNCMGNLLSDKKCHKYTIQYILETAEGETKNSVVVWQYICTRRPYNSMNKKQLV